MYTARWSWLLVPLCLLLVGGTLVAAPVAPAAAPSDVVVSRDFWSYDNCVWGDGRPHEPVVKGKPAGQGWQADYQVSVPQTGWYVLAMQTGTTNFDLFVDGQCVYHNRVPWQILDPKWRKAVNLPLTAGAHTVRLQRVGRQGFPPAEFQTFELRRAGGKPENLVSVALSGFDAVRVGEHVALAVTGGCISAPVKYEVLRQDLQHPEVAAEVVGAVEFPAGPKFATKTVTVACPTEGVYRLSGRVAGGAALGANDWYAVEYAVVDTKTFPGPATAQKTLVTDIDCVTQTDAGKPIAPARFFECNGKTRITQSEAGTYRESNNCTGPEVEKISSQLYLPRTYSGFAYEITLPKAGAAYVMEIDYPDDARRAMAVPVSYLKEDGSREAVDAGYSGKSVETGGMFKLTHKTLTHHYIFWPYTREINVGLLSQQVGQRAAASHIRIYQYEGELPVTPDDRTQGRTFADWYEEGGNWHFLVEGDQLNRTMPEIVADYVSLNRYLRLARTSGMTAMNAPAVSYQGCYFPTNTLDGFQPTTYSQIRLTALLCEKYRMRYIPEVFPTQWYRPAMVWTTRVKNPDDLRAWSAQGLEGGKDTGSNATNCLHPVVQQAWVDTFKEIGDQLRDSPAFGGITVRLDGWQWEGDWCLTSLMWGYGDYNIAQFVKDTGLQVPGAAGDPNRFEQRYQYLTSPAVKERWLNWRCAQVLAYQRRLRDAFSGPRKDVVLYMVGPGYMDPIADERVGMDPIERFRGAGIDTVALRTEPGIALIPNANYGSRNTGAAERAMYDGFFDQEYVDLGKGRERGFGAYMAYQELGGSMPFDKLGVVMKSFYYCSGIDAAGFNSLEKYAVALAEQDSDFLRDGGNSYIFGDPTVYAPWMREYNALPRVAFTPLAEASDPVAVWQYAGSEGRYFYAVNRDQYPVTMTIALRGAETVTDLGTGEKLATRGGVIRFELEPFGLRSFRAPQGATIIHATTNVPADRVAFVKGRVEFAQQVADAITTGAYQRNVTATERDTFVKRLAEAKAAFAQGHYWRARVLLSMAPMMQVYQSVSGLPEGQVVSRFPDLLRPETGGFYALPRPMLGAKDLLSGLPEASQPALVDSSTWNPEWGDTPVAGAKNGRLELTVPVPSEGPYHLAIGYVAQAAGTITVALDGQALPQTIVVKAAGVPGTLQLPVATLTAGVKHLTLIGAMPFGVYGVQLLPVLRAVPSSFWATAGPFTTVISNGGPMYTSLVQAMAPQYGPETQPGADAVFHDTTGAERTWTLNRISYPGALNERGVDFAVRCKSSHNDLCFAQTFITAPRACDLLVMLATDWWANLYLNGQVVTSPDAKLHDETGSWFNSKYFVPVVLHLNAGVNRLLVKNQAGSMGNSFMLYAVDSPEITFAAKEK